MHPLQLRCAALAIAGLVWASCLAGPAQSYSGSQAVVARTTTRLVEVSVTVRDRRGAPVPDLSKDDFILTEDRVAQEISFFTADRTLQREAAKLPELPPGAVSNRTGIAGGATVLLLDGLNTTAIYRERATPRVAGFLRAVAPLERVAVYVLRSDLTTVLDFTTDTATLLKTLAAYRGERPDVRKDVLEAELRLQNRDELSGNALAGGNPAGARAALLGRGDLQDAAAAMYLASMRKQAELVTIDTVRATCAALRAIANRVRGIPGRKNLIWVTAGFPLLAGRQSFTSQFESAVRELNSADVSVYPVDARGLLALTSGRLSSDASAMLRQLAQRTGGRAFEGRELEEAGREVFGDAQASYTLGYYPSNREFDGRFRRIEVRLNRPGLIARHRAGYYAAREQEAGSEQVRSRITAAVWNPLDATGLGLDAWLERSSGAEPDAVTLRLHGGTLPVEPQGDRHLCRLQVVLVQTNAAGRQLEGLQDSIDFQLTSELLQRALGAGLAYRKTLRIHPEAAAIRVVVRSAETGALGSVRIPVTPSAHASPTGGEKPR